MERPLSRTLQTHPCFIYPYTSWLGNRPLFNGFGPFSWVVWRGPKAQSQPAGRIHQIAGARGLGGAAVTGTPMMWPINLTGNGTRCQLRPANTAGAIIGKSGNTLKQIRERWDSQLPGKRVPLGRRKSTAYQIWGFGTPLQREGVELRGLPLVTWGFVRHGFFPLKVGNLVG